MHDMGTPPPHTHTILHTIVHAMMLTPYGAHYCSSSATCCTHHSAQHYTRQGRLGRARPVSRLCLDRHVKAMISE